jgi:predicted Holliday junction resolvase-like endonuclease
MGKFIKEHFEIIFMIIVFFMVVNSCGNSRELKKIRQDIVTIENKHQIQLRIEGLKTEKRMIQSTDRKILDVQRENEIEKEIKTLEEKIK